jgi:outer membrane lipopolysaccharide assembly protein LptE/RlpB
MRLALGARLVIASALLLPSACGFHLQGRAALPADVKSPYVEAPDVQTDCAACATLLTNGATLVPEGKSSAVISILQDQMTRRVVSVSAAGSRTSTR